MRHRTTSWAALLALAPALHAFAGDCAPHWSAEFIGGDLFGGAVKATIHFDHDADGATPPGLVAAGYFISAGGLPTGNVARWDGTSWSGFAGGTGRTVNALAIFDADAEGSGAPELHAAGDFFELGGDVANRVARWDGASWQPLGSGLGNSAFALAVFDEDGAGPGAAALFAGGEFSTAGGFSASRVARWDGAGWSAVGGGLPVTQVKALAVFDTDGAGPAPPALYAGSETGSGGAVHRWNGASWATVAGVSGGGGVNAMTVFDLDGDGEANLVVVGEFTSVAGAPASYVASWDGSSWSSLGAGVNFNVNAVHGFDLDGAGPAPAALYVGGQFGTAGGAPAKRIARWDGATWSPLGIGMDDTLDHVDSIIGFDGDGPGPALPSLFAGGFFQQAGGVDSPSLARWDGATWSGLGGATDDPVMALAVFDDGGPGGAALYAGGAFVTAGGGTVSYVARRDAGGWSALGGGMSGSPIGMVEALEVFDEDAAGPGLPALFAGGWFTTAGGVPASRVARWDGAAWSALGSGTNGNVHALAVHDADGAGPSPPALYAGGGFSAAGGEAASRIARWDGTSWSPLGAGASNIVEALVVYDADGAGPGLPALYAGGVFTTAGGQPASRIAKWDGATWSALSAGIGGDRVQALAVFDEDGGGPAAPALFVGGDFTTAGGIAASHVARWDGASWSAVGGGMNDEVEALAIFDDGSGPALYAGGVFTIAGGVSAGHVARWDGASWSPLGEGVSILSTTASVGAFAAFDLGGSGPGAAHLVAGGNFDMAGGLSSPHIAAWAGCPPEAPGDLDGDGGVGFADLTMMLNAWGACSAQCPADLDGSGFVGFADLNVLLAHWG